MSTNIHNQTISSSGTVLTVTRPVSSQSGSNQQPQILSVVSNPSNQANFSQVVLTPSRPASNTVTVTPASVSALSHQRGSQPRVINLNQPLRLGGQILTRPTMTLNQNFPVARNTFIIRDGTLQFLNMNHNLTQSNQPQTLRLQTMVPHSTNVGTTIRAPQMTAIPNSSVITSRSGQVQLSQPLTIQTTPANAQAASSQPSQMSPNTAKIKCKNFLSTLIRLASDQPEQTANNVKNLIQSLIDGVIEPDEFTNQLQSELNSSPQPCLIPFLKKSLPYLRHSLMVHETAIDGVRPPPPGSVQLPLQPQSLSQNTFQLTSQPRQNTIRVLTAPQLASLSNLTQGTVQITNIRPTTSSYSSTSTATTITPVTSAQFSKMPLISQNNAKIRPSAAKARNIAYSKEKIEKKAFVTTLRDDDDINDVAAMGGVNLVEESQRILATNAEFVGAQIRSCKDENFLFTNPLQNRINEIAKRNGLDDVLSDVVSLVSHAAQERLKTLVEKLGIIAEHRMENFKSDPRFEVTQDVRAQTKFLEELDRLEKKRHEEQEREMLMRAAKSRSKLEDPEQLKLKQKAKEMQRAELEEARQREANETALLAIGPRKKLKTTNASDNSLNNSFINNSSNNSQGLSFFSSTPAKAQIRRFKRVNIRDLQFLMEQEREMIRSVMLYKAYVK
ncbi:transcription initiation factor TFIID subunit 4B-like isoform X2 [Panonychus citri]|uniref:transcription initiation factor TFIID subunit 4B-like isoform X2 n=1 Tax=Panonychus citri TaxID=50023 RepID=UPI0023080F55|nr:transcription initiation factor TFIID subunit 4B-like isoform X2 [Panonychus citri]XP_053205164.1 transcription initiation factor TFIID subunit 4B-like isoform X2 [Panonychus citri]